MPKKLDELEAVAIMRGANFEPLEPYKLIKSPWKCKCLQCGNITFPILNNVRSGHGRGCKTCGAKERGTKTSLRKRMSEEDLNRILAEKFVELLEEFKSTKSDLRFRCLICSHEFTSKVRYIQEFTKYGCPECRRVIPRKTTNKTKKVEFDNVRDVARSLGFETETERAANEDLIQISCLNCNAVYTKKLFTFKKSRFTCNCIKVSAQEKKGIEYLEAGKKYASSRGGEILSQSVLYKLDKVLWKCSHGHQWEQPIGVVVGNESWCPTCGGNAPRTLDELRKIVEARGGKLLSSTYKNVDATYDFECSLGHKFSNSFKHVVGRGQWCPRCNKGSKSEEICRTTFEQIFGFDFPKARPKWLRNSRANQMEIDGYCEELKIGFEYQGVQHFGKQFYGTSLEKRIADDEEKARLCKEHSIHLFIIDYRMDYSEFPNQIFQQAKQFGMDISLFDFAQPIDLNKAYIRDDRMPILIELLKAKRITVLSNKWIGVKDKYEFRCEVCGHKWEATGNHFFNSRRVGGCQKCSIALLAGSNRLNLEEVQAFAIKHGGICLSSEYGEIKKKYKFRCQKGHEFEDIYNNMKYRNRFCPTCEGRFIKRYMSDDEALEILSKYNLEPRAPRPKRLTQSWPATCLICHEKVSPSLQHLLDRESPCKYCSGFAIPEHKVLQVFKDNNFDPIEPFTSGSKAWKSKCLTCGSIVRPRYDLIMKGTLCCRTCYYQSKKK
jgi:hypothetical protein